MFYGIDRIIIAVKSLDESKKFFEDLLDVEFDIVGASKELQLKGAYSASKLELIEPYGEDSILAKQIEKNGEGIIGIVVRVKDIEAAAKRLEEKGLKKTMDFWAGNMREIGFSPKESHGVQIVLAEYPEKHPATIAAWKIDGPVEGK